MASEMSLTDLFGEFDHIATRRVTWDKDNGMARVSTSRDEENAFNLTKGENAYYFRVDEDTAIIRFGDE